MYERCSITSSSAATWELSRMHFFIPIPVSTFHARAGVGQERQVGCERAPDSSTKAEEGYGNPGWPKQRKEFEAAHPDADSQAGEKDTTSDVLGVLPVFDTP